MALEIESYDVIRLIEQFLRGRAKQHHQFSTCAEDNILQYDYVCQTIWSRGY